MQWYCNLSSSTRLVSGFLLAALIGIGNAATIGMRDGKPHEINTAPAGREE